MFCLMAMSVACNEKMINEDRNRKKVDKSVSLVYGAVQDICLEGPILCFASPF